MQCVCVRHVYRSAKCVRVFFCFHFVICATFFPFLQYLLSFLGVSSSAVLHNSSGFSSIVYGVYFFQTICVMCVLYSSFNSMFIRFATDVYRRTHTRALIFHSFVRSLVRSVYFLLGMQRGYAKCEIILTLIVSFCLALAIFVSTF